MLTGDTKAIGRKMRAMASTIEREDAAILADAGQVIKRSIETFRNAAVGADAVMSGVGQGGAKLGVKLRSERRARGPQVFLKATGPWQLIESDTAGRVIRSRYANKSGRGGRARRRGFIGPVAPGQFVGGGRRAVLNIPGIGFRRSARHPGTRGKHPWRNGLRAGAPPTVAIVQKKQTTSIVRAFRS